MSELFKHASCAYIDECEIEFGFYGHDVKFEEVDWDSIGYPETQKEDFTTENSYLNQIEGSLIGPVQFNSNVKQIPITRFYEKETDE